MEREKRNADSLETQAEWPSLHGLIEDVVARHVGHHPGVITEAVVESIVTRFEITPREVHHRERRKNHLERIRRLSHEVFRILDSETGPAPVQRITARILKAFILVPQEEEGDDFPREGP